MMRWASAAVLLQGVELMPLRLHVVAILEADLALLMRYAPLWMPYSESPKYAAYFFQNSLGSGMSSRYSINSTVSLISSSVARP
jgi:hypothetical protein